MPRSNRGVLQPKAFSARLNALQALRAENPQAAASRLHEAAEQLRKIAEEFGDAPSAPLYAAFADLTDLVGLLYDWREAVRGAGVDATRFLTAAQTRAGEWLLANGENPNLTKMKAIADQIAAGPSLHDVPMTARALAGIPIPVGIFTKPKSDGLRLGERMGFAKTENEEPKIDLAVAFLTFTIDGTPLAEIHHVLPGEAHDIDLTVRVSRWPKDATHLVVEPITVEAPSTYDLPTFRLPAPHGEEGPFKLTERGRFVLRVPQHFGARPFEFQYTARFEPSGTEQPVEVAGQRTLSLEGLDLARNPLTGYPAIDNALVQLRNLLRLKPHLPQPDSVNAMTVMASLGNLAGQAAQDNIFPKKISEKIFQQEVRAHLRREPKIGAELEEHPRAGGGITDLSFHGIRIELKVEGNKRLVLKDCTQFVGQAASYTVGTGKRVGILCVLDCSPKGQAPFPAEDGIGIYPIQEEDGSPVYILIVLVQGNLAKPSDLSR